jgi:hypothetical protein
MKAILNRIKTIDVVSIMIIAIGFAFLWTAEAQEATNAQVASLMVMVTAFYFSASSRSAAKDKTIQKLSENQPKE